MKAKTKRINSIAKKKREALIGTKIGKLSVLSVDMKNVGVRKLRTAAFAKCKCECGAEKEIRICSLVKENPTTSCGCDFTIKRSEAHKSHSMYGTPIYQAWQSMKARCSNPNLNEYKYYGARGIFVCDRWMKFENFYHDMGDRPRGMTLDRKDNERGYEPDNCRWATKSMQSHNRRPMASSGIRNVYFKKGGYEVSYEKDGKANYLGRYKNIRDAERVALSIDAEFSDCTERLERGA